jgi:hypothetical protein
MEHGFRNPVEVPDPEDPMDLADPVDPADPTNVEIVIPVGSLTGVPKNTGTADP